MECIFSCFALSCRRLKAYSQRPKSAFTLVVLSITLVSPLARAQNSPGSPYTYFGIGDIYNKGLGHQLISGGTGIADRNGTAINNLNPASYSSIGYPYTFLNEFGLSISTATREDGSNTGRQFELDFPYLAMAFKTGERSGASFGLRRFSHVNYDIFGSDEFNGIPGSYQVRYEGSGGLSEFYFGYGRKLSERLSVGAHFSYVFGSLQNDQFVRSADINYNVSIEDTNFLSSLSVDLGLQYTVPIGKSALTLGATYDSRDNLGSSRDLRIAETQPGTTVPIDEITTIDIEEEDDYILPHSFGFGLSWNRNNKFKLSLDLQTQLWSESSLSGDDFSLRDSRRGALGFEKLPNYKSESYWGFVSYGFGFYTEQSYLVLDEEGLNSAGATFGVGLPIGNKGMLRIIGERAFRGQQLSDFFSENYTQLTFSITFMDLWFSQRKFY